MLAKFKGGVGASTLARELALAALGKGQSVAMVDLDAQGATVNWWNRRTKPSEGVAPAISPAMLPNLRPEALIEGASSLRAKYDLVLIDAPPTIHDQIRSIAQITSATLIPTRPNGADLDTIGPIYRLLKGAAPIAFAITQAPGKRSVDAAEATELLARTAPVFGRTTFRSAYARPPITGSTGYETDRVVREEIDQIYANLAAFIAD